MFRCRGLIFDLDGTLVDAFGAVADALNASRAAFALPALPVDEVRGQVGWGLIDLLTRNLGPARVEAGREIFERHYRAHHLAATVLLPGAAAALDDLARRGARLGVASNKPPEFTRELMQHLGLAQRLDAILGPGPGIPPKPDPAMLRAGCERLGTAPPETLYVGDMPLDVESAQRAGLPVVLVPTGAAGAEELSRLPGATVARDLLDVAARVEIPAARHSGLDRTGERG